MVENLRRFPRLEPPLWYGLRTVSPPLTVGLLFPVSEVGLNVGWQLTRHVTLYAGYSFLWVNTVARAGEQIDPVVNTTQFPILSGNGPLVGLARPAFHFDGTDFWAQGLDFGLELRY
jgi:hypothetical protein